MRGSGCSAMIPAYDGGHDGSKRGAGWSLSQEPCQSGLGFGVWGFRVLGFRVGGFGGVLV